VLERDRHLCTVPGCTREAGDAHHVVFRSHGGGDETWNQTGLCPPHHLHGVHRGYLRVTGRAPDGLRFAMLAPPAGPLRLPSPWPPPAWVE
jgi:5-methylcytosine-specific restriction endonuclease McrA